MAKVKLALSMKPEVIKIAKQYARDHDTSVSAIFSRFVHALMTMERSRAVTVPPGSALAKLSGIVKLPEGKTIDDVRFDALVEKYGLVDEATRTSRRRASGRRTHPSVKRSGQTSM